MNIKHYFIAVCMLVVVVPSAAQSDSVYQPPCGKEIFIPKDLADNDFTKATSKWSYANMAFTPDVVVFWEKPFGGELAKAPDLEGKSMKVDLNNLLSQLQRFYTFYKDTLQFIKPGSKADRYRMMVMLNYSLEGTAYGGDYDNTIGALWIAPNRVQDSKLNCIAHELGHSFQSQICCDDTGKAWGGGGIFEMASQWMLWQVNSEWTTDENYHWKGFIDNHHLRFLAWENIYHSPFVLEYWSMKRGRTVVADLFRAGEKGDDPATTYMKMFSLSIDDMNNEMAECYARLLTFDFPRVKASHKKFPVELLSKMDVSTIRGKTVYQPSEKTIPQIWGFNIVELDVKKNAKKLNVDFTGLNTSANATYKTMIVGVDEKKDATYSPIYSGKNIKMTMRIVPGCKYYAVVVGCPKTEYKPYTFNPYEGDKQAVEEETFPYKIVLK